VGHRQLARAPVFGDQAWPVGDAEGWRRQNDAVGPRQCWQGYRGIGLKQSTDEQQTTGIPWRQFHDSDEPQMPSLNGATDESPGQRPGNGNQYPIEP